MRGRAAFLHIAKCAGSSVEDALVAATGSPLPPRQQFDTCYLAGTAATDLRNSAARDTVAWDDLPEMPGPYVFHQHWSLPTLLREFDPADVATVLREPRLRILSFVEFVRAGSPAERRFWAGDDVLMPSASLPLVELLQSRPASRAVDNLIVRQVMWGDPRIDPVAPLADTVIDGLAGDAIAALEQLGVVGLVEQMDRTWESLSRWLGSTVRPRHSNATAPRPVPGLFDTTDDIERSMQLLADRSRADLLVWQHFAARSGVVPLDLGEQIRSRLEHLSRSAFVARYRSHSPGPASLDETARELDRRIPEMARLLTLDLPTEQVPRTRNCTFVGSSDDIVATETQIVVEVPNALELRDLLAGRDFDVAILGERWVERNDPYGLLVQLYELLPIDALLLVACPDDRSSDLFCGLAPSAGWGVAAVEAAPRGRIVTCRMFGRPTGDPTRRRRWFGRRSRSRS